MKKFSRRKIIKKFGIGAGVASVVSSIGSSIAFAGDKFPERKLNVALCGLGRYANILKTSLAQSSHCRLNGIITGSPSKADRWRREFNLADKNIYSYSNFDTLIDNSDIDLVYITLPNGLHKEYVIRAAKAGKHVIVEKPMALTEVECKEMIDACKKAGVQLAVGYRLHYDPYHIELKRLGQNRVFGQVRLIEASLGYRLAGIPVDDWHLIKRLSGGGPLMNLGVYCIQSCRYTLGEEPYAVTAQFGPVTMPETFKQVEENISWQMKFPSGALSTSSSTSNCNIDRFYASADDGFFELAPALSYGPFKGRTSVGAMNFPIINQQAAQLDDIASYILSKQPLPSHISGEEGRKDMRIIEAIYRAAETGKTIKFT